jgi:hypothetical protein
LEKRTLLWCWEGIWVCSWKRGCCFEQVEEELGRTVGKENLALVVSGGIWVCSCSRRRHFEPKGGRIRVAVANDFLALMVENNLMWELQIWISKTLITVILIMLVF